MVINSHHACTAIKSSISLTLNPSKPCLFWWAPTSENYFDVDGAPDNGCETTCPCLGEERFEGETPERFDGSWEPSPGISGDYNRENYGCFLEKPRMFLGKPWIFLGNHPVIFRGLQWIQVTIPSWYVVITMQECNEHPPDWWIPTIQVSDIF